MDSSTSLDGQSKDALEIKPNCDYIPLDIVHRSGGSISVSRYDELAGVIPHDLGANVRGGGKGRIAPLY